MNKLLVATLCLLASACVNARAEREALLSPESTQLLSKYRHFMTQKQLDEFLAVPDEAGRAQYVEAMRVGERLALYPVPIQDAIWAQDVISGMDKPAVLLSWGVPRTREFSGEGGNEIERWSYLRDQHQYEVTVTNGYVTDVKDEGVSR